MNTRSILVRLGIATAVATVALSALTTPAMAQKKFTCRMKGTWADAPGDVFEFDAAYIYRNGEDDFNGIYDNPGQAKANVEGSARKGTWNILLTYLDDKHKNMFKKLIGTGSKDPVTHEIVVKGDYKTFLGTSDIKKDGQFVLHGKCR